MNQESPIFGEQPSLEAPTKWHELVRQLPGNWLQNRNSYETYNNYFDLDGFERSFDYNLVSITEDDIYLGFPKGLYLATTIKSNQLEEKGLHALEGLQTQISLFLIGGKLSKVSIPLNKFPGVTDGYLNIPHIEDLDVDLGNAIEIKPSKIIYKSGEEYALYFSIAPSPLSNFIDTLSGAIDPE